MSSLKQPVPSSPLTWLLVSFLGIIISYELYMRRWLSTEESLVFESHGLVSSHSALQSVNPSKNLLQQPQASTFISGLEPHTEYAFRVLAVNMAGRVSSAWASERTGESGKDQFLGFLFKNLSTKVLPGN